MKIWGKILLGFLSIIVISIIVDIIALRDNIKIINDIHKLELSQRVELNESNTLSFSLQNINSNIRELFIEHGSVKSSLDLSDAKKNILDRLPVLSNSLTSLINATEIGYDLNDKTDKDGETFELQKLDSLKSNIPDFISLTRIIMKLLDENHPNEASELFENEAEPKSRMLEKIIVFLADDAQQEVKDAIQNMDVYVDKAIMSGIYLTILSVLFAMGIGLLISRSISGPLQKLSSGAEAIGRGNYETKVDVNSNDELGSLAESFNQMAKDLKIKITTIDNLNKELTESNDTKNKFFSIIAHDLRSPFNIFLGLSQILVEELPRLPQETIQTMVVNLRDLAISTFGLLENLLLWAKSQQGVIPFNPEKVLLMKEVNSSIQILNENAKSKNIKISSFIRADMIVLADSYMLQSIIRNLFSNALKFTNPGGEITISATIRSDKSTLISIKDTGIGMSRTILNNLFRIDSQTSRKGTAGEPSSGLGLLLCKEFVEKHGGKIRVESQLENLPSGMAGGSEFTFSLPAEGSGTNHKLNYTEKPAKP